MTVINKLYEICNGIIDNRDIPEKAKKIAKENGYIIIIGGSDDLMYAYGAKSYLTEIKEHSYGWNGDTLENINDKQLECEAKQLGLRIYWCGKIFSRNENLENNGIIDKISNYNISKQGGFYYTVKKEIKHKHFIVYTNDKIDNVYCTGIIIKLPKKFKPCFKNK